MPLDLQVRKLQIALFLSTLDLTDRLGLAMAIRESSGGVFNAEPLMLPVPDDAPAAIPRLRIENTAGTLTCQITPSRVDLWSEPADQDEKGMGLEHHARSQFDLTSSVWNQLQEQFGGRAHRVGFVSQFTADTEDANSLLRGAFLRTDHFNASHRLELHALYKTTAGKYSVNRWVRLRALPSSSGATDEEELSLEVDINTLPENALKFSTENLNQFLEGALHLLQETKSRFTSSVAGG